MVGSHGRHQSHAGEFRRVCGGAAGADRFSISSCVQDPRKGMASGSCVSFRLFRLVGRGPGSIECPDRRRRPESRLNPGWPASFRSATWRVRKQWPPKVPRGCSTVLFVRAPSDMLADYSKVLRALTIRSNWLQRLRPQQIRPNSWKRGANPVPMDGRTEALNDGVTKSVVRRLTGDAGHGAGLARAPLRRFQALASGIPTHQPQFGPRPLPEYQCIRASAHPGERYIEAADSPGRQGRRSAPMGLDRRRPDAEARESRFTFCSKPAASAPRSGRIFVIS